jgi:hypothetical protein
VERFPSAVFAVKAAGVAALVVLALLLGTVVRAANVITGEILDYEKGYVVLTSGASYPVAPNVTIVDAKSGQPTSLKAEPGVFAQLTVGPDGMVTDLALSKTAISAALKLPSLNTVAVPLAPPGATAGELARVRFIVTVPPTTQASDQVYMTTSETSWAPTAVRMDRVDSRHFSAMIEVPVGKLFLYLYTRGSPQSLERDANGLQRKARELTLQSSDAQVERDAIQHWGDEVGTSLLPPPQTFPTPYNAAPFPNLPPTPRP